MKNLLFTSGTLAICAVLAASAQEERSPLGAPVAGANVQVGGAQAGVQASVSQTATPLLLNLSGTTVKDESGQQLGQIQHLIVSPQGCVDMAVLSLGGAKLVPIPWQLVEVSTAAVGTTAAAATPGRIALKLNVDKQKLQQAPSFSMNQINQITQQQTIQQVYNFYGVQQTQSGVGASASQSSSITGGAASTNTAQSSSQIGATGTQTNQFGTQGRMTNQFGIQGGATNLSPTGRTNGYPLRPGVGATNTNTAPGRPDFAPGRPENRPPANRPPDNRPPTNAPQGRPFQDTPAQQQQQQQQPQQ